MYISIYRYTFKYICIYVYTCLHIYVCACVYTHIYKQIFFRSSYATWDIQPKMITYNLINLF